MDRRAPTSTGFQRSPNASADRTAGPVFIDSEPLYIYYMETPPSDFKGYYSDGIEYYCCINHDCRSAWAAQWTLTPRGKRIYGTQSLAKYRETAVSKICDRCKQSFKNTSSQLTQRFDAHKAKRAEEDLEAAEERMRRLKLDSLPGPSKRPFSQVDAGANAVAKENDPTIVNHDNALPAVGTQFQNTVEDAAANLLARHPFMHKRREQLATNKRPANEPFNDLIDVPLSPPPPTIEDPAMLAVHDPSWDVISENDANEDWAVINHFGSAAIHHRDAHGESS
ncbi:hypothetical protein H2200_001073 [Cladophialophora chaetospira]|uniref:Uncharacterized protein n=1 Tax=Cladophialophora chaetospira TaxID=386627 RepID=A0AA38XK68_9EURO|nr:hypothetical protein H2200_001073 [Cladophialophora chaetospira]